MKKLMTSSLASLSRKASQRANAGNSGADTPERTYARRIQMAPERTHRSVPPPGESKWLRTCVVIYNFPNFFWWRYRRKTSTSNYVVSRKLVRLAATETDCPMPRFRATRYPCKTINRSKSGLARSCQKPPCRRVSRAHVYRVVIRQDRLVVS